MLTDRMNSSYDTGLASTPNSHPTELYEDLLSLQQAVRNVCIELDRRIGAVYVEFSEAVDYGELVNLYDNGGTLNARLSNLTTSAKPVRGFCSEVTGVASGATGLVLCTGKIVECTGLTPGATYYGSNTGGGYSLSAGTVPQAVGFALSATELYINPTLI